VRTIVAADHCGELIVRGRRFADCAFRRPDISLVVIHKRAAKPTIMLRFLLLGLLQPVGFDAFRQPGKLSQSLMTSRLAYSTTSRVDTSRPPQRLPMFKGSAKSFWRMAINR
jgi:hypothetical protein